MRVLIACEYSGAVRDEFRIDIGALCDIINEWNMHLSHYFLHIGYADLASSNQDGELETSITDLRLKTFGGGLSTTSALTGITESTSETGKEKAEELTYTFSLLKCLLGQSRLLELALDTSTAFHQTTMPTILRGEPRSKMSATSSVTGLGILGIQGSYQENSAKKYCAEQKTESVKEFLLKSMGLADQLLPGSLMVQRGDLN